jgi:LPS export ABC transporter protein LptC
MKVAKQISNLFLPVIIAGIALVTGCENSLQDIQKISAQEVNKPLERYTDVDVIYSDSARVKAHMTAPLMIEYKTQKPYTEMPKGVKVIFYDNHLVETSTITSEYAIRKETEKIIELDKNVVGTNAKGDTFTSEELIWDEGSKKIHSNKLVHIKLADGSITDGTSFISDEDFNHWTITQGTGKINVKDQSFAQ